VQWGPDKTRVKSKTRMPSSVRGAGEEVIDQ